MRLEVLLLAADPGSRDLLLRLLGRHRVTVAASPDEALLLLQARPYGVVIVTNDGIPAEAALAAVPSPTGCPVLFLPSHASERLEQRCIDRGILVLRMPDASDVLCGQLRLAAAPRPDDPPDVFLLASPKD